MGRCLSLAAKLERGEERRSLTGISGRYGVP